MKTLKTYKPINLPPLDEDQLQEIKNLNNLDEKYINYEDAPRLTEEQKQMGHFAYGESLRIRKIGIHTSIDEDNLEWIKSVGEKGYQTRLNKIIRWARLNNCPIDQL